ncbi:family 20 glycosylhydrolase [Microbacterium sp.]|uniref:family 20 glycosylhydrolase n=1 Tax=Microbacterium sp. TaxID=51671 RepID=UPI0028116E33|nr:family 20 glycosylhydrolase [Microbacterium sp.]
MRNRRTMALASCLAVAGALLLAPGAPTTPAAAEEGPALIDGGFESGEWGAQTQHNHASLVTPGADGTGTAAQIGLAYADATTQTPIGGNLPVRGTGVDRGMVNKTVTGVQPNTTYRFSVTLKGKGIRWGIFDTENAPYYRGLARGDGGGEYAAGITTPGDGTQWSTYTTTITTGPRTTELNAFCLVGGNTSPAFCDDFRIAEVGPATTPQEAPASWDAPPLGENGFPVTIPAVQSFAAGDGEWDAPLQEFIVDAASADRITDEVDLGAASIRELGVTDDATLSIGDEPAGENSVFIRLGDVPIPDTAPENARELSAEAYAIETTEEGVTITAGGEPGVLHALSTLGQALQSTEAATGTASLPVGTAVNWTDMRFRALQVDSGRRFYSIDWLKDQIKDLAWTSMNTMVLRVKDGQGLRVESEVFPELVDHLPDGGSWSKAEVRELVEFARQYHVTIIPEFDMPAHATLDSKVFTEPGYMLAGEAYNYSRPDVRERLADVAVEMGGLFDAPYVHIGADEFMALDEQTVLRDWIREETGDDSATTRDSYAWFLNYVNAALEDAGRKTMVWNDQLNGRNKVVPLDEDITVIFWAEIYGSVDANDLLAEGRQVIGSSSDLYHDLWPTMGTADLTSGDTRNGSVINRPLPEYAWKHYPDPYTFSGGWGDPYPALPELRDNVAGQFFPIWDDAHGWAPEHVLTQTLLPRLRLFAQTVWNSPQQVDSFAQFDPYLRFLGHSPFFGEEPVLEVPRTPEWDVSVDVDPKAGSAVKPGTKATWTITLSAGDAEVKGAQADIDLADVLDNTAAEKVSTTAGTVARSGSDVTWKGDLPVDGEVRITVTARVTGPVKAPKDDSAWNDRVVLSVSGTAPRANLTSCEGCTDAGLTVRKP